MSRQNLLSLFEEFQRYGGDVAVVQRRGYRREKMTYFELYAQVLLWGGALQGHGIRPGDRVLLWGQNSAVWIVCFWAILMQGAVAVPMDCGANADFVRRVIQDAGVKLVLRDRRQTDFSGMPSSIVIDELNDVAKSPQASTSVAIDPGNRTKRSDIAQILYTSGTTAEPRGVVLTHGNFLANLEPLEQGIDPYRKYERWFHPLRFVSLVPLSHVFGQFMALFVPPLLGATVIFEHSANPSEIMRTVKRERATALIAVPRMLDALHAGIERDVDACLRTTWLQKNLEAANGEKFLQRTWRFRRIHRKLGWKFWAFISGGAALSKETEEFFKRVGYAMVQGYGMTETASLISLNHPFRATEGSIGKVLPGREFRLAEDGEILVRGENVAAGYWEGGTLRKGARDTENWLHTGDIGEVDVEGNLRFKGRKKNVIVTPAGLNVYPEDIEAAFRKQHGVRDCVVIPLERGGNAEPCAILLVESNSDPEAKEQTTRAAIEKANDSLAEYQQVHRWLVWQEPEFPRTPTGKPRLSLIAARAAELLEGKSPATGQTGTLDNLLAKFSAAKGTSVNLERELNLSSLDRVELMSALEDRYQVELNETSFSEAKTVVDVQHLLQQRSAARTGYAYPRWTQRAPARWLRLAVYYALSWPATKILGHPKIVGRENLRGMKGPALVISNHITRRADIGLILAALPIRFRHRLATAMGGESVQRMRRPPREWFFAKRWAYQAGYWLVTLLFNVFPLPQHSGFRESFRFAGESADRGYSILIFPEGEVNNSEDGRMAPFQSGIGLLAENLRLPIIPMRLDGVWRMKREHRRLARFGEIKVHIGAPVTFPPDFSPEEISRRLESIVLAL